MNEAVEIGQRVVLPKDGTAAKGRIAGISDNLAFVVDPQGNAVNVTGEHTEIGHHSVLPNEGAKHCVPGKVRSPHYLPLIIDTACNAEQHTS
jgi:hypothetical protein